MAARYPDPPTVRVLDGVSFGPADAAPPPRQMQQVLAMLVAAAGPVPSRTLAAALSGPDEDEAAAERLRVRPVVSRLRPLLRPHGLDIPSASATNHYRLVTTEGAPPHPASVDAYAFAALVGRLADLPARDAAAANRLFDDAAHIWRRAPFAVQKGPWALPPVCAAAVAQWDALRGQLVRRCAEITLRTGDQTVARRLLDGAPLTAGLSDAEALWLLRFLGVLRDEGEEAAARLMDARGERTGAQATHRPFDILELHQLGVDVARPLPRVLGPGGRAAGPERLIGRPHEAALVAGFVNRAAAGERVPPLIVQGVPGVGKTRLLAELGRLADARGLPYAAVTCEGPDDLQVCRVLAAALWADVLRDSSVRDARLTAPEHHTLSDLVGVVRRNQIGSARAPMPDRDVHEVEWLLWRLLDLVARRKPFVVILDNAHLLTPVAAGILAGVRVRAADHVRFAAARRPVAADEVPWGRDAQILDVPALNRAEVDAWLSATWPRAASEAEAAAAYALSGGLPLALVDLTPDSLNDDHAPASATGSPEAPDEAADGVPDDAAPLLHAAADLPIWSTAAAVAGTGLAIDVQIVADMLDIDSTASDRHQSDAARAGLVTLHSGARFRHDVVREELLGALDRFPALARDLHKAAYRVLHARLTAGVHPCPSLPVRVAQHALAAGSGVADPDTAAACLVAARAEQSAYAWQSAAHWAQIGLELPSSVETRVGLLVTLGDAYSDGGEMHEAGGLYREACSISVGLPYARAAAAIRLARRWSDPGQVDDELPALLASCLASLAADPSPDATILRMQLRGHLAHKLTMGVHRDAPLPAGLIAGLPEAGVRPGVALARAALADLPDEGDPAVSDAGPPPEAMCEVLEESRMGLYDYTPPLELLSLTERLHRTAAADGVRTHTASALVPLAIDLIRLGRVPQAREASEKHRRALARFPRPHGQWLQWALDGMFDLWHGDLGAVRRRLDREQWPEVVRLEMKRAEPADTLAQTALGQEFWWHHERGEMAALFGGEHAKKVAEHAYVPIWRVGEIVALCDTGQYSDAADRLLTFVDETDRLAELPPHGWSVPCLCLLAECCTEILDATEDAQDAPEHAALRGLIPLLADLLAPHAEELALAGWPTVLVGPVARFQGRLALLADDRAAALAHFRRAERLTGTAPTHRARLRLDTAVALRPEDPKAADRMLIAAHAAAESLGMRGLVARARVLLDASR